MMHSFLKVANTEGVENLVVMTWVRQIRELAYDVEDCIEFVAHLDKKNQWWFRMIPSWCVRGVKPLDQAVSDIEQLKARVEDVSTRNNRYSLISGTGSKPVVVQHQELLSGAATAATNMLAEARGATKRQQGFGDLTRLITEDKCLQVMSVWGAGGDYGTTSIIRRTFNHPEICNHFTNRLWVKLMHPFCPRDFIRSMMAQFYANSCEEEDTTVGMYVLTKMGTTEAELFKEFQRLVTQQMYLVVLDGLTSMVDWDAIMTFLPDMKRGSWIIVSTQQPEIATLCVGHSYQISELKKYSDHHSIYALFKGSEDDGGKPKKPVVNKRQGPQEDGDHERKKEDNIDPLVGGPQEDGDHERQKEDNIDPLVGRKSRMNELGKYAAKARANSPPVMSVWGIAGVGKTALVRNLFDIMPEKKQFDKFFWVDVSHPFKLRDLYMSLLPDLHSENDLTEECHTLLRNNRCLIVIDDLLSTKEWDLMQAALVCKYSRSLIIVITTQASIAKQCTNNEDLVFNVKPLEAAAASDLFQKQALNKNPLKFQDVEVQELIFKCGGIPKVIAAIAGLLATKDKCMDNVRSLNSKFMHHLETDPDCESLQDLFGWLHSYFRTCPDSLKPCIFYLSIFPPDHRIRRRRLVRRWIAEGYSRDNNIESAEENGEKDFAQLLELSIIQKLSSQSSSTISEGKMVLYQVNGFIREYIVSRQMEENLVFELGDKCAITTQRTGRHLVILKNWDRDRIVFESIDFSRLRSLTVFGIWKSFFISEGMKMLRVLDLEDASALNVGDVDKIVDLLRRLKFLSLRGHSEIHHLPKSLKHMRQLQTLDVRDTSIVTMPRSITKLQKLQYIRSGTNVQAVTTSLFRHRRLVGVMVPRRIGKLTALHTLGVVNIGVSGAKTKLKQLKKLTQLRKLGVSGINMKNIQEFVESVHGAHLESLSVQLDKDNEHCLDDISMSWVNLRSLKLCGLGYKLPKSIEKLSMLTKLDLEMVVLMQADIELLAKQPELCILRLTINQPSLLFYVQMSGIEEKSYEKVKILEIACSSSRLHVTFGSNAMRNLELLKLDCSSALYRLSGLNYLSELKEVTLKGTNDETLRNGLENQLMNHPRRPAAKLDRGTTEFIL